MPNCLENLKDLQLRISKGEDVTEEDVRQSINEDIRQLLKNKYGKTIFFRNEKKTSVNTFIDSKYENFIIEYKKPSVTLGDEQKEQLISYLEDTGPYSWGILTNGRQLDIYTYSFATGNFEKNSQLSGDINEYQFEYICAILANKDSLILDENTINEHLGIENNRDIIQKIFHILCMSKNLRTQLLYDEWQKLFNLSEDHDQLDLEKKEERYKILRRII